MALTKQEETRFWAMRAKKYEKLEWVNKGDYLGAFLDAATFHKHDVVLDVGTGTGIIAHSLAPHVGKVVGIDISHEMLKKADDGRFPNTEWKQMDAPQLDFEDHTFSKVTARMVFHHLLERAEKAMQECLRVLKPDGTMIFSEGVPPTEHVKPFFTEMFKLKEKRITFMDRDLEELMGRAGFKNIRRKNIFVRQASIRNWLENSGIPQEAQDKIFQMHVELDEKGKKDYNMAFKNGDCFIDMKFCILTGEK